MVKILSYFFISILIFYIQICSASTEQRIILVTESSSLQLQGIITEILQIIPDSIQNKIYQQVSIEFGKVDKINKKNFEYICGGRIKVTSHDESYSTFKITVDNYFNEESKLGEAPLNISSCKFKSYRDLIKYQIVHELAHIIDENFKYSKDQSFSSTVGWINRGLIIPTRQNINQNILRSPDPRELSSEQEAFATNVALFIVDKNFKCHRPSVYKYFSTLFQTIPFQTTTCNVDKTVMLSPGALDVDKALTLDRFIELNHEQLYQIHYFLAEKGSSVESRFGHSMFRLVFCKKDVPLGPHCLNDSSNHVIAGFKAQMGDSNKSYMKGLNGGYPSQLFFYKLNSVLEEYTKGEQRSLKSIPINFSREQMELFLDKILEINWSYAGKYFFLTNNCATESMNLLKAVLGDYKNIQSTVINTPLGVYNYLDESKLSDVDIFNDLEKATIDGYYFPSISTQITKSLNNLNIKNIKLDDFLDQNDAITRRNIYQNLINNSNPGNKVKLAANALRIENIALLKEKMHLNQKATAELFAVDESESESEIVPDKVNNYFQNIQKILSLYKEVASVPVYPQSYGIPLKSEVVRIPIEYTIKKIKEILIEISKDKSKTMAKNTSMQAEPHSELTEVEITLKYLTNIITTPHSIH